jgi:uncharacterized protein (TIGR03435 family)
MIEAGSRSRRFSWAPMLAAACLWIFAELGASAQTGPVLSGTVSQPAAPAVSLPAFDVVSIKPSKADSTMIGVRIAQDGIFISGMPLHMMLREAFGVSNDRLVGEPGWMNSGRFDVDAKVAAEDVPKLKALTLQQCWAMLLPVFEDRLALKFHHETKELSEYVLVIAKGGLKMKEAASGDAYPNGLKGPDGRGGGGGMMRMAPGELIGQGVPIATLVRQLSFQFGSTIVDKTDLAGKYDFDLKWTPDETAGPMFISPHGSPPEADSPAPPPTSGPSLFTALQEQLGLKLEAHKEPADVIVIDHIEPPSPN